MMTDDLEKEWNRVLDLFEVCSNELVELENEESVLLFEVGRSVGYICKKQSFVWGNMHYLAKYSVRN